MTFLQRLALALILLVSPAIHADSFLYDATGQLQRAIQSDGPVAGYGYDASGNISGVGTTQAQTLQLGKTSLLSLSIAPFANPTSATLSVTADLSLLGGSPTAALNDSGTNGDAVAGDGIYSLSLTLGTNVATGTLLLPISYIDDQGRTGTDYISATITAADSTGGSGGVPTNDGPTMPEWMLIILATLLVLIASRSLPKQAALTLMAAGLLSPVLPLMPRLRMTPQVGIIFRWTHLFSLNLRLTIHLLIHRIPHPRFNRSPLPVN